MLTISCSSSQRAGAVGFRGLIHLFVARARRQSARPSSIAIKTAVAARAVNLHRDHGLLPLLGVEISMRQGRHPAILALSGVFLFTIRSNRVSGDRGMQGSIGRRQLLAGTGAALLLGGLEGCATLHTQGRSAEAHSPLQLVPVRASTDRITRITVCTRPFRAQGPRLDAEQIGTKLVVHNYGHGGSGWSLSWGSSSIAVRQGHGERRTRHRGHRLRRTGTDLGVAAAASRRPGHHLRQGAAAERAIVVGHRTVDSRFAHLPRGKCDAGVQAAVGADGARLVSDLSELFWGCRGTPVEFIDNYFVSDEPAAVRRRGVTDERARFADLQRELMPDLIPQGDGLRAGQPFARASAICGATR